MAEWADAWRAGGPAHLWGSVPQVIELQSEVGAAGVLHWCLQRGTLAVHLHRVAGVAAWIAAQPLQNRR